MGEIERLIADMPTPGPSPAMDKRLEALFQSGAESKTTLVRQSTRDHLRSTLLPVGASAAAIGVLVVGLVAFSLGQPSFAFSDVQASVYKVRTVQYLRVFSSNVPIPRAEGPETAEGPPIPSREDLEERIRVLRKRLSDETADARKRRETAAELKRLEPFLEKDAGTLLCVSWTRISGANRQRDETIFPSAAGMPELEIFNGRLGKHMLFDRDAKQAMTVSTFAVVQGTERQVHVDSSADFFRDILEVPEDRAIRLPEKTIDGKRTVGFRTISDDNSLTKTWWVDRETRLPVRIEWDQNGASPEPSVESDLLSTKVVFSDFTYDEAIDDSLFDVSVPDGYTHHDVSSKSSAFEEEDDPAK